MPKEDKGRHTQGLSAAPARAPLPFSPWCRTAEAPQCPWASPAPAPRAHCKEGSEEVLRSRLSRAPPGSLCDTVPAVCF